MSITIGVPRETGDERRVAFDLDVVKRLKKKGVKVLVENGAGTTINLSDNDYQEAGALVGTRDDVFASDIVVKVQPPDMSEIALMKSGSVFLGFLNPLDNAATISSLASQGVQAFAMEMVPRISRAQKMDALSAMANIAGYKAVIAAAYHLPKYFPLLTTAAGTVKPANVLVLGAGVAGLQAIATARRLGARVAAYDIREAVKEQVESLGARFVELEFELDDMEDSGGYAKALGAEKARQQTTLLIPEIAKSDVIITTALIPGRAAPVLITDEALAAMSSGSVIVDLAAANGGNCSKTEANQTVTVNGVTIIGETNYPSTVATHGTQLYGRTLLAMLDEMVEEGALSIDYDDEVMAGACITRDGHIVNERVKGLIESQ